MAQRPEQATSNEIKSEFQRAEIESDDPVPAGAKVGASDLTKVEMRLSDDQLAPPNRGFGRLWRKVYWIELAPLEMRPEEIVTWWKEHFDVFWPGRNRFHASLAGIKAGELALVDIEVPGGTTLASGIVVLSSRPEQFVLMTPLGHIFAGWIAFSAETRNGAPVAQIEILMRASDPLFEVGMTLFGHRRENRFWMTTLENLSRSLGTNAKAKMTAEVVDPHVQWRQATNIWHNAAIRTFLRRIASPFLSRTRAGRKEDRS